MEFTLVMCLSAMWCVIRPIRLLIETHVEEVIAPLLTLNEGGRQRVDN